MNEAAINVGMGGIQVWVNIGMSRYISMIICNPMV